MLVLLAILILCGLLSLIAYFGTGSDEKNLRSFGSYPKKVQERIRKNHALDGKYREPNLVVSLLSNFIVFSIVLFLLGLMVKTDSYFINFLYLFFIGQIGNVFDLCVLDMLWWRNSKRVRVSGTEDMHKEYQDLTPHLHAFYRALVMFTVIAAVDGALLLLF